MIADDEQKFNLKESEASNLLRKVAKTPVHRLKNVMFKKMLLKLIYYFYEERAVKDKSSQESFCDFVYGALMKKYMMKKAAESKYNHLLASCVKYKSIIRVRLFGRFLGLYDELSAEDLDFFIECLNFLQNSPSGIFCLNPENTEIILLPYVRCVECLKAFEKFLPKNEIPVLRAKLEKMKREDKINKLGVVDMDEFLEQLIEIHNDHTKSTKHFMDIIYGAADLNDDGYLQYKEFELLMHFLSSLSFSESLVKTLFEEYAETFLSEEDDQVKAISFENLCEMNLNYKIFNQNTIKQVTKVRTPEEASKKLESMYRNIDDTITELYWRFSETQMWEEHIEELNNLLEIIKDKLFSKKNPEKSYLAYCLVDLESKRILIEEKCRELMPSIALGF